MLTLYNFQWPTRQTGQKHRRLHTRGDKIKYFQLRMCYLMYGGMNLALPLRCCDQSYDPADWQGMTEAPGGPCRCLLPALWDSPCGHKWGHQPSPGQKKSNTAQKTPVIASPSHHSQHHLLMLANISDMVILDFQLNFPFDISLYICLNGGKIVAFLLMFYCRFDQVICLVKISLLNPQNFEGLKSGRVSGAKFVRKMLKLI